MKVSTTKNKFREFVNYPLIKNLIVFLFWVLVWQAIYTSVGKDVLVASPVDVFFRMCDLVRLSSFWNGVISSMFRVLQGFIYGVFAGVLLSVLTCLSGVLKLLLKPIISIVKSTPVASFIILALVWIKSGFVPVFISMLMVLPIVWANVSEGISKTDRNLLEMAKVFNFTRFSKIKKIYIPSVMPYFVAACTTSLGLSWKAGIAAEVIGNTKNSIGSEIYKSKMYLETVDLFAFTITVIILSMVLEYLIVKIMTWISKKYSFSR